MIKVGIIGAGSWGTALAKNLADKGESVYASYRATCVNDLYADRNDERIEKTIAVLTVEQNEKVIDDVYKRVKKYWQAHFNACLLFYKIRIICYNNI